MKTVKKTKLTRLADEYREALRRLDSSSNRNGFPSDRHHDDYTQGYMAGLREAQACMEGCNNIALMRNRIKIALRLANRPEAP